MRVLITIFIAVLWVGCANQERLYDVEARCIAQVADKLRSHDILNPESRVTNLVELFADGGYPYHWHERFKKFGKYAGFDNSFYEKYAFFPPRNTHPLLTGELFLMNSRPFPGPKGLGRNLLLKSDDVYHFKELDEESVQRILKDLQLTEPKPVTMPSPPPAPSSDQAEYGERWSDKRYKFFHSFAERLGLDGRNWWMLQTATFALLSILLILVAFTVWRRYRE